MYSDSGSNQAAGDLATAALAYSQWGWHVHPLRPRDKTPLTPHGCKDATRDPTVIAQWWRRWPDANIGVALGAASNLLAIDLDVGHEPGVNGIHEWDRLCAGLEVVTARTSTGGGGGHLLFRYRDLGKATVKLAPGVDTRGEGLYVVAPPSIHPSGQPYAWLAHPEEAGIADLPAWLSPGNLTSLPLSPAPDAAERCRRYLAKVPDAVSGSGGHNATLRAACECYRFGLTGSEAWDLLSQYNATRCYPAWSEKELRHKWSEAKKVVDREGKFGARLLDGGELQDWLLPAETSIVVADGPGAELEIINMSDVRPEDVQWLWPDRMALGCITVLAGRASGGKGLLTMDLTARVTTGRALPDGSEPEKGSVIILAGEDDPARVIRPRLDAAGADVKRVGVVKAVFKTRPDGTRYRDAFTLAEDVGKLDAMLNRLAAQ